MWGLYMDICIYVYMYIYIYVYMGPMGPKGPKVPMRPWASMGPMAPGPHGPRGRGRMPSPLVLSISLESIISHIPYIFSINGV